MSNEHVESRKTGFREGIGQSESREEGQSREQKVEVGHTKNVRNDRAASSTTPRDYSGWISQETREIGL
jgi:hypothetical protein